MFGNIPGRRQCKALNFGSSCQVLHTARKHLTGAWFFNLICRRHFYFKDIDNDAELQIQQCSKRHCKCRLSASVILLYVLNITLVRDFPNLIS
jgi:hypothetical protein